MEHLILALGREHHDCPIKILSLATTFEGPFSTFPARTGWDISTWRWENNDQGFDPGGRSTSDVATFLQTWLFFGVLRNVLCVPAPEEAFTRRGGDGETFLTTVALQQYVQA